MILALFERIIRTGTLEVRDHAGRVHRFGDGTGEPTAIALTDSRIAFELAINPRLKFGEAYMSGRMEVTKGTIRDVLDVVLRNLQVAERNQRDLPANMRFIDSIGFFRRKLMQLNNALRSKQNVAHHYDLSGALYDLFLDVDRQYSCAYFPRPDMSLEDAQIAKKRHIIAKLRLEPGQRVLDIGSGWGGLGLSIAEAADVEVLGITLSEEQLKVARERAKARGLDHKVKFELIDYRALDQRFDRIVSVGMFEHVGLPNYRAFFDKVKGLLTDDGVALIHAIGRNDGPGVTNAWIRKYIFPGGYSPAVSEVMSVVEKTGLWVTDIEILRMHYAYTLHEWQKRFAANRDKIKALYDERFCRMFEFYLAGSEHAFRYQEHMVWQMQITRSIDAVPLTRDYMVDAERADPVGVEKQMAG